MNYPMRLCCKWPEHFGEGAGEEHPLPALCGTSCCTPESSAPPGEALRHEAGPAHLEGDAHLEEAAHLEGDACLQQVLMERGTALSMCYVL